MWQRIQTLWLLLAGVVMTILLFLPLATSSSTGIKFTTIGFTGGDSTYITWGLFALDALMVLFAFLTIFLFKKRILQMRLCIFNILLHIGFIVYYFILFFSYGKSILPDEGNHSLIPSIWILLPILSIFLIILAYRGIRKDEILVRMSNRIR